MLSQSPVNDIKPMEKYRNVRQIGQGSFGSVLLVKDVDLGEDNERGYYVVKQVNTVNMTQVEQQKVLREVALLSDLIHPNIVMYKVEYYLRLSI